MNKIKIERVLKLEQEDSRNKGFNPLSGAKLDKSAWINSMGTQKAEIVWSEFNN